ncbi:hypothetical protein EJB05_44175, partial [Eragrostis curvula]
MLIDVAIEKVQGLINFFKEYRESGFLSALETAKKIALEIVKLKERSILMRDQMKQVVAHNLRRTYLESIILIIDQAISSLTTRFEQYQGYQKIFGFLFTSETLLSLDRDTLNSSCERLEAALRSKDGQSDIDAKDLFVELILLQSIIPNENRALLRF